MRKNYFAKKFVAYSMAFAVAFSTLTVSPVFVKEAKAATITVKQKVTLGTDADRTAASSLLNTDGAIGDLGKIWVDKNSILSDNTQFTQITESELLEGIKQATGNSTLTTANLKGAGKVVATTGTVVKAHSSSAKNVAGNITLTPAAPLGEGVGDVITKTTNYTKLLEKSQVAVAYLLDGKSTNQVLGADSTDPTANVIGAKWFKVLPRKAEFDLEYTTTPANVVIKPHVTVNYYEFKEITSDINADTGALSLGDITKSDFGLYLSTDSTTENAKGFYNICQKSDLEVVQVKKNVVVAKGSDAKLSVQATATENVKYTWKKGDTTLSCTDATLALTEVKADDFGDYECIITDGIKEVKKDFTLEELKFGKVKRTATTINTIKTVLDENDKFPGGEVSVATSIPDDSEYKYIWTYKDVRIIKTADVNDVLAYTASSKTATIKDTNAISTESVKCYAVRESVYNEALAAELKKLNDSKNDVEKVGANESILDNELTKIVAPGKYEFVENFTFEKSNALAVADVKNASEVKKVTLGSDISLESQTDSDVDTYEWTFAGRDGKVITTTKTLALNTVDVNDLGTVTCTAKDDVTPKYITIFNLITTSDLTATASDVTAKAGTKVEATVTTTSLLPSKITWTKITDGDLIANNPAGATDPQDVTPATDPSKLEINTANANIFNTDDSEGATTGNNFYICTVTDGIKTVKLQVKVTEIKTFKVYVEGINGVAADNNGATYEATSTAHNKAYYAGLAGDSVTLAPIVKTASEDIEKQITYKWEKSGNVVSTDKELTVQYPESGQNTYTLTVTDGTKTVVLYFTVKTIEDKDIKALKYNNIAVDRIFTAKYTGKEINPVKTVKAEYVANGVHYVVTLKEGTDYTVKLSNTVNTGVGFYDVVLIGNLAEIGSLAEYFDKFDNYNHNEIQLKKDQLGDMYLGEFTIVRADNEIVIANNTVILGNKVAPKVTTNLGKGTLTYTYYSDKAGTNEIPAPTKVGTYYVKATSAVTTNYDEADSNVATVKVVPGKVKMLGTSRTASSVKLNWNKATGATSYRVYYKAPGAKSYKVFKNTTATSMNVTGLASATTYTFAVKAYAKTAGYSTVYATKITTTAPAKVSTPSVTAGSKKATVKFTKVARATGYQIYMAKGNGKYVKVKTTTSTSFTKTRLAKGATYKFKVRAYKTVGSNTYYGAYSSAKAVVVK